MSTEYIKNPRTVKLLAEEIKIVCDDYWGRKITDKVAKDIVLYWAKNEGKKLFQGDVINSTIRKIIGQKRVDLINRFLEGTQYSLFL